MDLMNKNILFAGHNFQFARHILDHYASLPGWNVLRDHWSGHHQHDPDESEKHVRDADLIFCEWCLGNAVWYSKKKRPGQRLVIRLHHQEMGLKYLKRLNWENVDAVILVCKHHTDELARRYPDQVGKLHTIHNMIDTDRLNRGKLAEAEHTLGLIGFVPRRKAPHLALEVLAGLASEEERWRLRLLGKKPEEFRWMRFRLRELLYYRWLYRLVRLSTAGSHIRFDGYTEEVAEWLRGIGFILSTSEHESFHVGVAEGMASGAIPVVRDWEGARNLYPEQFIYSTVPEAVGIIRRCQEDYDELSSFCRDFARRHFDLSVIIPQYEGLLGQLMCSS
jgi:glycosyltransferase involved in cell wall biosynthesis